MMIFLKIFSAYKGNIGEREGGGGGKTYKESERIIKRERERERERKRERERESERVKLKFNSKSFLNLIIGMF